MWPLCVDVRFSDKDKPTPRGQTFLLLLFFIFIFIFSPSILSSVFRTQGFFPFVVRSGDPENSAMSTIEHGFNQKDPHRVIKRGKGSCTLYCDLIGDVG